TSALMLSPFKARSASAPPSAAMAWLTRLLPFFCAMAGCAWTKPSSSAADIAKAYFIAIPPVSCDDERDFYGSVQSYSTNRRGEDTPGSSQNLALHGVAVSCSPP